MEIDTNPNPYASPSVHVAVPIAEPSEPSGGCPPLPLAFHPAFETYAYILPIALIALSFSGLFVLNYILVVLDAFTGGRPLGHFPHTLIAIIVAFFGGFVAFACLKLFKCKVVISDSAIEISELTRRVVRFSEIDSWHHHTVTGSVSIEFKSKLPFLIVENYAMSEERSKLMGLVLKEKIGPPSG